MLSTKVLSSAKDALDYYGQYYTDEEGLIWWGKGAEALNLSGEVRTEDFQNLLKGNLPNGVQLGRIENGERQHRPGFDLTFSAPKSISIAALFHPNIVDAHDKAVQTTLTLIEKDLACARITKNRQTKMVQTENLVVALKQEYFSRLNDPQLHTHGVVMNATLRGDGRWVSLGSDKNNAQGFLERLRPAAKDYDVRYQAQLAYELKALGYEIHMNQKGVVELKGFPRDLIEFYSKRHADIVRALKERGLTGAKAAEVACLATRPDKTTLDVDAKKLEVQQTCLDHGIDILNLAQTPKIEDWRLNLAKSLEEIKNTLSNSSFGKLFQNLCSGLQVSLTGRTSKKEMGLTALKRTIEHLAERQAVFESKDIFKAASFFVQGELSPEDLDHTLSEYIKESFLIAHPKDFTTKAAIECETQMLHLMFQQQGTVESIRSPIEIKEALKQTSLNQGQRDAVVHGLITTDRFSGVQGFSGTGKTTMMNTLSDYLSQSGLTLLGVAPTGNAAEQLATTGIETMTLFKFFSLKQDLSQTVVILDESSQVSTPDMLKFMDKITEQKSRALLVGDVLQQGSIEWGKAFWQLQKAGLSTIELKEIVRQKNPDLKQAVLDVIDGQVEKAIRDLHQKGYIKVYDTPEVKVQKNKSNQKNAPQKQEEPFDWKSTIAQSFTALSSEEQNKSLLLIPRKVDGAEVTEQIRKQLKKSGTLSEEGKKFEVLVPLKPTRAEIGFVGFYRNGYIVRSNIDSQKLGLVRDAYYQVTKTDSQKNVLYVKNPSGKEQTIDLNQLPKRRLNPLEIFERNTREICIGDKLVRTRSIDDGKNGELLKVKSFNEQGIQVEKKSGEITTLELKRLHQHWDYALTKTVYVAQSLTSKSTMTQSASYLEHLTHREAFYVAISRAEEELTFFVNDLESFIKKVVEPSQRPMALTLDEIKKIAAAYGKEMRPEQTQSIPENHLNKKSHLHLNHNAPQKNSSEKNTQKFYQDEEIAQTLNVLNANIQSFVRGLLGEPTSMKAREWRYGKKGSLCIQISGDEIGRWKDFEQGPGGNLINLHMHVHRCDFKTAMDSLTRDWSIQANHHYQPTPKKEISHEPAIEDLNKIRSAQSLWRRGKSIEGTLAERYLKTHRGIQTKIPECFRFGYYKDYKLDKTFPALFVAATHPVTHEVQAIQVIYLNGKTANKAQIEINKRIIGCVKFGAHVKLQTGQSHLYVAEGPETALSILEAAPPNTSVIATLSVSNFTHLSRFNHLPKNITFCADNDGPNAPPAEVVKKAAQALTEKNYHVQIVQPKEIKTDFNDVHRSHGINEVKKIMHQERSMSHEIEMEL